MKNSKRSTTTLRNTRFSARKLQDFIDYSIRRYDGLGRLVSAALKDTVHSARSTKLRRGGSRSKPKQESGDADAFTLKV